MTTHAPVLRIACLAVAVAWASIASAAPKNTAPMPDFTQGGKVPEDAKHDWNLGPTGLRGWIYFNNGATSDARQVLITEVDKGSPAANILQTGDVLLGAGGAPFTADPRAELGKAIMAAEASPNGKLALTRWRAGKTEEVAITLPILGSYSATAPFNCPKSQRLLELGCKALAERMARPDYAKQNAIPRSLNALALLASGNPDYLPLVKKEAQWAAGFSTDSFPTWYYAYVTLLVAEYALATGDQSVLPGLERLALAIAKGQSAVGSWGHGWANPDGGIGAYGMMNSPGLVLTISLVLARQAGVKDPAVATAIERSARLVRFYVGKGGIPYGDHNPWLNGHETNGKNGMGAVLFNLLGEAKSAEYFSRLGVASHGSDRDAGHSGNYFNILWAMPSVALSGPNASGAWMKEFGAWYYDLARRWDGSFAHQGPPAATPDRYQGWDNSGALLLAYATPLKKISLTGRWKCAAPELDVAAAASLINDGHGSKNNAFHDELSDEQLLDRLSSWSPVIRERAAQALGRRKEVNLSAVQKLLESPKLETRCGACQALAALGQRAAPAVEPLRKCLADKDMWVRVQAAEALAQIGAAAAPAVPQLLELLADVDPVNDPRGMQQRYLARALFDSSEGGLLSKSLQGVDRAALYKAVQVGLKNEDGGARGSIRSVYKNLSAAELAPLWPAIHRAVVEPAPSGEMFADAIRVSGLQLLAKHRIEEGLAACVQYTRTQNPWHSPMRTKELMKVLLSYGAHAKAFVPELTAAANHLEKVGKGAAATSIREAIRAVESSTETPKLVRLGKELGENRPVADPARAPAVKD